MTVKLNWGTGIAIVYAVFALATTGFVTFAMGRSVDLVSDDYYAQSLRQNGRMEAERNTRALRPAPSIAQHERRSVVVSLPPDQAGVARGRLTLYRPSDARADRTIELALDRQGRQIVRLDGLAAGHWIVKVRWTAAERDFYFEQAVFAQ